MRISITNIEYLRLTRSSCIYEQTTGELSQSTNQWQIIFLFYLSASMNASVNLTPNTGQEEDRPKISSHSLIITRFYKSAQ